MVLRIGDPQLAALPWEAMYDPSAGAYVCRHEQLVRHVPVASAPTPLAIGPPLRVLGIVSSSRGLDALDADKERGHLRTRLALRTAAGIA